MAVLLTAVAGLGLVASGFLGVLMFTFASDDPNGRLRHRLAVGVGTFVLSALITCALPLWLAWGEPYRRFFH